MDKKDYQKGNVIISFLKFKSSFLAEQELYSAVKMGEHFLTDVLAWMPQDGEDSRMGASFSMFLLDKLGQLYYMTHRYEDMCALADAFFLLYSRFHPALDTYVILV
jgi:hypothetical protein